MVPPVAQEGAGWFGTAARIVAFVLLGGVIAFTLGAGYSLLPRSRGPVALLAQTSVPATAALIAGVVLLRFLDGRSPAALGIGVSRRTAALAGVGVVIGMLAIGVATLTLLAAGMLRYGADTGTPVSWLGTVLLHGGLFAIAALAEEAIFRGYPFQVLVRAAGAPVAILLTSAAFAWVHGNNPGVGAFALLNIFLAGILLALAYLRTLSLWFATAVHLGWNWTMATLCDLPVSGIEQFDTPLYQPVVTGPAWLSGGEFGPEGGLVGTIALVVALVAILLLPMVRPDPGVTVARPLALREEPQVA